MSKRLRPQTNISLSTWDHSYQRSKALSASRPLRVSAGDQVLPSISPKRESQDRNGHRLKFTNWFSMLSGPSSHALRPPGTASSPQRLQHTQPSNLSDAVVALVDLDKPLPPVPIMSWQASPNMDLENQHPQPPSLLTRHSSTTARNARIDREIWKMMLLNMYPVTYLILWIPGIANRLVELLGHSSRVLTILQSSTQFIGLANASLYIYKEHGKDIRRWCKERERQTRAVETSTLTANMRQWPSDNSKGYPNEQFELKI